MKQVFLIVLLGAGMNAAAQKIFTEAELIAVVRQFHPIAKQASIDISIADANITSARGAFDPVLSFDRSRKELDGLTYYDQRITEVKIPTWYGIQLYAGSEHISGDRINPEATRGGMQYLGASLSLLQGLMMDKRRAVLQQSKVLREQSVVERRIVMNDLLREAVQAYWQWWGDYNNLQLVNASLVAADKRLQLVRTGYRAGEWPGIDTVEALSQVQHFQVQQSEAELLLAKSRLQLSLFLWRDSEVAYELPPDVVPPSTIYPETVVLDDFVTAARRHPQVLEYQYKLNFFQIEKQLKFQSLLPEVDVKYNQTGRDLNKTFNNAWFQNNYRFGVSVSMPLRLSEGRGGYQAARLKLQQTRIAQQFKQVEIENKVKQSFTEWQQTGRQLQLQQQLVANYATLQRGEETKFINGESTLFLINAREQKALESQQKMILMQVKNKQAFVTLQYAAGMYAY